MPYNNNKSSFNLLELLEAKQANKIVYHVDSTTGLKSIIAIHNNNLGPALGGVRIWNYKNEYEALQDALRLAEGMTYKSAIADLDLGGGKAIIFGDALKIKTTKLLQAFGRFVDSLNGQYITASDVNSNMHDMVMINKTTQHVVSLPKSHGGSGDSSIMTAHGIYVGMKAALKHVYGNDNFSNKKILIQGVGKVGSTIIDKITKENAKVYVSDISSEKLKQISNNYNVTIINPNEIYDLKDIDIYSPNALGGTINEHSINKLSCKIIAGGANNQLKNPLKDDLSLFNKGIIYVPDFVISAGGVINVNLEHKRIYNEKNALHEVEKIYDRCLKILNDSKIKRTPTNKIATELAEEIIKKKSKIE